MARGLLLGVAVVVLGLTLPGRRDLETLGRYAENWANARLAEWETSGSVDGPEFVVAAEALEPAATPVAIAPATPILSWAPEEVPVSPGGAGGEAVAVGSPEVAAAGGLAIAPPVEPAAFEPPAAGDVESPGAGDVGRGEVASRPASRGPGDVAAVPGPDPDLAFGAVVEELASAFDADRPAPSRRDDDFATVVEGLASAFDADAAGLARAREASRPAPAFEPWELGDDLYSGPAYALNRASEGLGNGAATAPGDRPGRGDRLTTAVRLTREAVVAWASLLDGPAVVTITR